MGDNPITTPGPRLHSASLRCSLLKASHANAPQTQRPSGLAASSHTCRRLASSPGDSAPSPSRRDEATACQCAVARLSFKVPYDIYTLFTLSDTCRLPHTIDDFPFWVFDSRYTDFPSCFISPGPFALIALSRRVSSNLALLLHPLHSFCPSGASSI
ncbi:hypothetical protein M431DRAFT_261700 [Trichoderma harzianum CBS 226.95]|uniref:Uncharacterized protein n=1 Tax=Trichoderma harzianum CBS 226.95 TaxID=983964 RepID=A0A2T3ZZE7_TRIHA|nr:hypothetical protein M431DRAFT_261700 [Trichoderma harzianum CBS 226.95]PTB50148.1 hypothetical protein M431DRAFT_261700 [Trichoderma harzianum CBS 226.95]